MYVTPAASGIILLITVFLAVLLFVASKNHQARASKFLLAAFVMVGIWLGGAILASNGGDKVSPTWLAVSAASNHLLPWVWLAFVLAMNDRNPTILSKQLIIVSIPALCAAFAVLSAPLHGLYWPAAGGQTAGVLFWVGQGINSLYLLGSVLALLPALRAPRQTDFQQIILMIVGTLVLWGAQIVLLAWPPYITDQSVGPYWAVFAAILLTYAIFHLRFLQVAPPAIDAIADALPNGVLAVSNRNIITYINPAAERILNMPALSITGQPIEAALTFFPPLSNVIDCPEGQIVRFERDGSQIYLSICITAFYDHWNKPSGKMLLFQDVTKQVQAENDTCESQEKLRQSEEMHRQLVENISEILYILDLDGMITYISPTTQQALGLLADDLIGQPYRNLFGGSVAAASRYLERTLAGETVSFEFNITNPTGNSRTLLARQRRILQDGQVTGVQGILSDISEQLQIEQALERRASQLAIVNDIGEKIAALMNLDEVLDSATKLIQTSFGYYHVAIFLPDPQQQALVMRSSSGAFSTIFPHNHHLEMGKGMVGWVAEHGSLLISNDVRKETRYTNFFPDKIQTRSELTVPVLLREKLAGVLDIQSPQLDAFDDNDVRVMKTIADQIAIAIENAHLYQEILNQLKETARKENMLRIQRDLVMAIGSTNQVQDMLEKTLQTLSIELKIQHAVIYLLDPSAGVLRPAAVLENLREHGPLTLSQEHNVAGWVARTGQPILIGDTHDMPDYHEAKSAIRSEACVPLDGGNEILGVIDLQSPNPNTFYPDDLRLLMILANNLVMLIERAHLFQEVEQARAELEERANALQSVNERLREMDRLKSQFLANISHELRTPLNSVIGFSEILIDNLAGPLTSDQEECVQNINDSGKHLLALINDLLDFSKIEAGRMTLEPETFDIAEMLDDLRVFFGPLAEQKAQLLSMIPEPDLPRLTADRMRIKQVLINLMSNASKFTPEGGSITVSCRQDGPEHVLFRVEDNGIGIRPEHQELIFEEFRQVDGSMSRQVPGSGLGLTISKRMVLLHHGQIWVESNLGQGACFYVRLPVNYQADMI